MPNRLRIHLLIATLAALMALAPAASAAAGQKAIWGTIDLPNGQSAFPFYKDLGVQVFQYQLSWADIAPSKPLLSPTDPNNSVYKWPAIVDTAIQRAGANGMSVALMARQTPAWANGGAGRNVAPALVGDYADFLSAARQRYPSVKRWMIWGETNRVAVWNSGPTRYSDLLDAAFGALKAPSLGDPGDNTVVGAMTFTYGETPPADWIAQLRRSDGARPRFDEYGHNPFPRRCPDLAQGPNFLQNGARDISDLDTLREDLRAAFGSYKPLWLSEFTVSSDRANRAFAFFVSRDSQADWLARAFRIAGHYPDVAGLGWFNLADENAPNGLTSGLLDPSLSQKPAYGAYKSATLTDTGLPAPCGSDAAPPVLSDYSLTPASFTAFSRGGSTRLSRTFGTRVSYRLSERATTTFNVDRALLGRRVGRLCRVPSRLNRRRPRCIRYVAVRATRALVGRRVGRVCRVPSRLNRTRPRCIRYVAVRRATFARTTNAGISRFRFTGRIGGRKLALGSYRLGAQPRDTAGNLGTRVHRRFRVVR